MKSFENHENSKKHKENVANMPLEDDIGISDNEIDDDDDVQDANEVDHVAEVKVEETKINGTTEEEEQKGNSTSDIEDNDLRETLSDDSDKVQVKVFLTPNFHSCLFARAFIC